MRIEMGVKEAFSFIRQMLSDAYGMDTHFFDYPYRDFDKIDRGFRRTVWKKDNSQSVLLQGMELLEGYHMVVMKSNLDFYNILAFLGKKKPCEFVSVGPFRDRPVTGQDLIHVLSINHLPAGHLTVIRQFYDSLPVADVQNVVTMLRHLLSAFVPEYKDVATEYVDFSEEQNVFEPDSETVRSFSGEMAEKYASVLNEFLDLVLAGDNQGAADTLKQLLDYTGYEANLSMKQMKKYLNFLNDNCCSRMLMTQVHASFILEQQFRFETQIENAGQYELLLRLPYEIARKYCLLVKNYSMSDYSYLVQNVMNYVTLHISEQLTLSVIAGYFRKNAAYLSGRFHKETGDGLVEYIQKERMRTAVRYFNMTNLSVAEVAGKVGIHDFGYFSRLFKKHVGCTPSQYKKMVNA